MGCWKVIKETAVQHITGHTVSYEVRGRALAFWLLQREEEEQGLGSLAPLVSACQQLPA